MTDQETMIRFLQSVAIQAVQAQDKIGNNEAIGDLLDDIHTDLIRVEQINKRVERAAARTPAGTMTDEQRNAAAAAILPYVGRTITERGTNHRVTVIGVSDDAAFPVRLSVEATEGWSTGKGPEETSANLDYLKNFGR